MNVTSLTDLNVVVASRLEHNTQDALKKGIRRIGTDEARIITIGSAAVLERWRCVQDHGFGPCGQALIPEPETAQLLGEPQNPVMDEPATGWLTLEDLDPVFGFVTVELFHLSHLLVAFVEREQR
ncbi:hypothetical protein ACFWB2_14580 [Streptomyces virginiae]|uniref:hypothetical protein n=1 Tax=Streptomyces TaxID=1883 RepID=UPI00093FC985|nr:hypothetical protein [Streptomyces sp. MJM1172]OKI67552.1 hypothetical protein AMK15_06140 [Streptomyces sp. MJM1172]